MQCDKRTYDSQKDAHDDLVGLRQRNGRHKFSTYKCDQYGKFHIVTVTKKLIRPMKKDKYPIEIPVKLNHHHNRKSKKNDTHL